MRHNFLFLCMSLLFLLKNGHLKYYNVATLNIRFSPFQGLFMVIIFVCLVTFLN